MFSGNKYEYSKPIPEMQYTSQYPYFMFDGNKYESSKPIPELQYSRCPQWEGGFKVDVAVCICNLSYLEPEFSEQCEFEPAWDPHRQRFLWGLSD